MSGLSERQVLILKSVAELIEGTVVEVSIKAGVDKRAIDYAMEKLITYQFVKRVWREGKYFYSVTESSPFQPNFSQEPKTNIDLKIKEETNIAIQLEEKGLINRAHKQWLKVFDLEYDEVKRAKIVARRLSLIVEGSGDAYPKIAPTHFLGGIL